MTVTLNSLAKRNILGTDYAVTDVASLSKLLASLAKKGCPSYVCVASVHQCMMCFDDPKLREGVNQAYATVPDGRPLLWMLRLLGERQATQIRGLDLTEQLLAECAEAELSVGFYGAMPDSLLACIEQVKKMQPSLNIGLAWDGDEWPRTVKAEAEAIEAIKQSGIKLLFVGLGCPLQERWMVENSHKLGLLCLGVGAAFDYLSGATKIAPKPMQLMGLEWFYRLLQEPRRLAGRYFIQNSRFIWHACGFLLRERYRSFRQSFGREK